MLSDAIPALHGSPRPEAPVKPGNASRNLMDDYTISPPTVPEAPRRSTDGLVCGSCRRVIRSGERALVPLEPWRPVGHVECLPELDELAEVSS